MRPPPKLQGTTRKIRKAEVEGIFMSAIRIDSCAARNRCVIQAVMQEPFVQDRPEYRCVLSAPAGPNVGRPR